MAAGSSGITEPDESAGGFGQAEGPGGVFIHVLNGDADPAAADLLVLLELVDDTFGHAARDGEADTLTAGDDGRVHPDNLAFHVDQGAAAVAGVDGGVRLEEVVKRPGLDAAALGAQDARGNRVPQAEGVADGEDPFAHFHLVGVAEVQEWQGRVGLYLEQGDVGFFVSPDDLSLEGMLLAGAALKVDENGIRASNHVVVGHDVAVGGNEEAGTEGALRTGLGIAAAAFELFKKTLEFRGKPAEHFGRHTAPLHDFLFGTDIDDGLTGGLDQRDEVGNHRRGLCRKDQ